MKNVMTPVGFANALKAGIAANFAPPNQAAELAKLCELLQDMAMSLEMQAEREHGPAAQRTTRYMAFLGSVGTELDIA